MRSVRAPGPLPHALELDAAKYAAYVADLDVADHHQRKFLETVWSILRAFIELGFSVEGSQLVPGLEVSCEQRQRLAPGESTSLQKNLGNKHAKG